MDAFSYLSVLLSIIIGLGITQVLTAIGRLIRQRERVRGDWLPLLWAVALLVLYVQVWWSMFGLRNNPQWSFGQFLVVLAQTATLYVMAALVLPEEVGEGGVDLRLYYEQQRRWFFAFFLATLVISLVKDVVINGALPSVTNLGFHAMWIAISISAIVARSRRYHEVVGLVSAASIATYVTLLFTRLR